MPIFFDFKNKKALAANDSHVIINNMRERKTTAVKLSPEVNELIWFLNIGHKNSIQTISSKAKVRSSHFIKANIN